MLISYLITIFTMKKIFSYAFLTTLMIVGCNKPQTQSDDIISLPRGESVPSLEVAVDSFYHATQTQPVAPDSISLHSIMVIKHGQVLLERWYNGHTPQTPHLMYSVSKTFTATAIGMAIDENKFKLDDKVVSFFPDLLPETVSDNLAAMTVRDLLTMTCGHDTEPQISRFLDPDNVDSPDVNWVKSFLAWPVEHKPGDYFLYNSFGTYMLSAIIQKATGEKLIDYLDTRLFQPLHIARPEWDESPQGICCGGWGLHLTTEDMAKMGQLFIQHGKWNDHQLVSSQWLEEMSKYQVPSAPSGTRFEDLEKVGINKDNNEWAQGYGYQMWVTRNGEGFRADGYAGQYIMVFPKKDAVLVLTTSSSLYQPYMEIIWQYLLPAL